MTDSVTITAARPLRWWHRWFPAKSWIPCTHPAADPDNLQHDWEQMTFGSGYGSGMDIDVDVCRDCGVSR